MISEYTDFSLQKHHTFGMDVRAARFVEYDGVEELKQIVKTLSPDSPFLHIGGGSNLLFTGNYRGTVLHSRIRGMEVVKEDAGSVWIRVGAGEVWDDFVARCVENGWGGAENLSLIPGEVGASAVQNIGAYGVEAKDLIASVETVEVFTGRKRTFRQEECDYGYRSSLFKGTLKGRYIVTHVTYCLAKLPVFRLEYGNIRAEIERRGGTVSLAAVRDVVIAIRRDKLPDPAVQGNAGSFFVNPVIDRMQYEELLRNYPDMPHYEVDEKRVKVPAAWMIERCGWKGRSMGRAAVHDRQALVLVNRGGATGEEILRLSEAICHSVKEKFGIDIHPEVNVIE